MNRFYHTSLQFVAVVVLLYGTVIKNNKCHGYFKRDIVVGVYSTCENDTETQQTQFSGMASVHRDVFDILFKKMIAYYKSYKDIRYYNYSVCNSTERLAGAVNNILLDEQFYSLNDDTNFYESKIMLFCVYLSEDLLKLFDRLVSITAIPVQIMNLQAYIHHNGRPMINRNYSKYIQYDSNVKMKVIQHLTKASVWNYTNVILLDSNNSFHLSQFEVFPRLYLHKTDTCLTLERITTGNLTAYKELKRKINRYSSNKVILVIGRPEDQNTLLTIMNETVSSTKHIWILPQTLSNPRNYTLSDTVIVNGYEDFDYPDVQNEVGRDFLDEIDVKYPDGRLQGFVSYYYAYRTFLLLNSSFLLLNVANSSDADKINTDADKIITSARKEAFTYLEYYSGNNYSEHDYKGNLSKPYILQNVPSMSCPSRTCTAGFEKKFDQLSPNETDWQTEYGWTCKRCQLNYFKSIDGDGPCILCDGIKVTDERRSICYDPYDDVYLGIDDFTVQICFSINIAVLLMVVIVTGILLKHRNTPVVRATDAPLTAFHLITCLLQYALSSVSYIERPSQTKCILQTVVPIIYTVNVGVVFVKFQKILTIFKSKLRLERAQVIKTEVGQIFVVILFTLVAIFITLAVTKNESPKSIEKLDEITFKRLIYCSSTNDINYVTAYIMCIQIACLVQAFRARNLPEVYNTAMSVVYGTFVTTTFFAVMFPIYYFQVTPLNRALVHWIVFVTNNTILIFMFYLKPTFVVVFRRKQNTRTFVQNHVRANNNVVTGPQ